MTVLASWIPMGGSVAGRPAVPRGMRVWWLAVEEPKLSSSDRKSDGTLPRR
jgi:hypothetical protein